ncbi:ChrB protein [Paenibacillus sp. LC231]|uniref:ChrB protein n=1 Tax=Paenibacillus stellifer TaxID=169760 RepID=A0A089LR27_9BACL|nr:MULTISPECIES: Chromate resistance protein ChrB [Paenibacillus]AIQ62545.1 ChrB protein [Paenibacillus stellifer]OIB01476.1 ChrB protein [Paenibacillus sp. LC231]
MKQWVLLIYKIPSKPTSSRVYIWRKLKRLGAVLWHDAVWILPATPKTMEHLQWLAAEIMELKGEAQVWKADTLLFGQEESLIHQFKEQADETYKGILEELSKPGADFAVLSRMYQHAVQQDFFQSEAGKQVRELLLQVRGG